MSDIEFTVKGTSISVASPCVSLDKSRINVKDPYWIQQALSNLGDALSTQLAAALSEMGQKIGDAIPDAPEVEVDPRWLLKDEDGKIVHGNLFPADQPMVEPLRAVPSTLDVRSVAVPARAEATHVDHLVAWGALTDEGDHLKRLQLMDLDAYMADQGLNWAIAVADYSGSWAGFTAGTVPTVTARLCTNQTGAAPYGPVFTCALPWPSAGKQKYPSVYLSQVFMVAPIAGTGTTYAAVTGYLDDPMGTVKALCNDGALQPVIPWGWEEIAVGRFLKGQAALGESLSDTGGTSTHDHDDHATHFHTQPTHDHAVDIDAHHHELPAHSHTLTSSDRAIYDGADTDWPMVESGPTGTQPITDVSNAHSGGAFTTTAAGDDDTGNASTGLGVLSHSTENHLPPYLVVWWIRRSY